MLIPQHLPNRDGSRLAWQLLSMLGNMKSNLKPLPDAKHRIALLAIIRAAGMRLPNYWITTEEMGHLVSRANTTPRA